MPAASRERFSAPAWTPACSWGPGVGASGRGAPPAPALAPSAHLEGAHGPSVEDEETKVSLRLEARSEHGSVLGAQIEASVADTLRIPTWDALASAVGPHCSLLFPERRELLRDVTKTPWKASRPWRKGSEPSPLAQLASCSKAMSCPVVPTAWSGLGVGGGLSTPRSLDLGTVGILGGIIPCCASCLVHCGMCRGVPGLSPLSATGIP